MPSCYICMGFDQRPTMIKRFVANFLLFCLVAGGSAASLVRADGGGGAELQLATQSYPPYMVLRDGEIAGPVVDLVAEAFRRMGRKAAIKAYPWPRALAMLERAKVDGLFTIKKTPERELVLIYPQEPLLAQDFVFFVRKDSNVRFDGNYASIAQSRVGVVLNTSYGQRFDQAVAAGVFSNVVATSDNERLYRMLMGGRIDAMINSRLVGLSLLRKIDPQGSIVVSGPPSETTLGYLVFTKQPEATALAHAFDQAMQSMRKDGTAHRLLDLGIEAATAKGQ